MKFKAHTDAGVFVCPSESYSLVLHDTGHKVQLWASDGLIDEIDVNELRQFTGLQDRNGADIYEGDIVKANGSLTIETISACQFMGHPAHYRHVDSISNYQCYWHETFCSFHFRALEKSQSINCDVSSRDYLIIGNVHQNPELLEQS